MCKILHFVILQCTKYFKNLLQRVWTSYRWKRDCESSVVAGRADITDLCSWPSYQGGSLHFKNWFLSPKVRIFSSNMNFLIFALIFSLFFKWSGVLEQIYWICQQRTWLFNFNFLLCLNVDFIFYLNEIKFVQFLKREFANFCGHFKVCCKSEES